MFISLAPLSACSCFNSATACSDMGTPNIVFVGRVLVDSGEGRGTRPARVEVEEPLVNVPPEMRQVDVDSLVGTSCYYRLQAGERYVVFAQRQDGEPQKLFILACSNTFNVKGKEHILDALRNQLRGGPSRLVGTVRQNTGRYSHDPGVAGATVVAESNTMSQEVHTDAFGNYDIRGLAPGRYHLDVLKDGFTPDTEYNHRSSGRFILNNTTNAIEIDKEDPGSVVVSEKSCAIWDLSMWRNGRISGMVRSTDGSVLSGITVQAFGFNDKGEKDSRSLRVSTTDSEGKYTVDRLPAGDYAVGVNAESYRDEDPYPPTIYKSGTESADPTRIHLVDIQEVNGIDLALARKRTAVTLRVSVMGLDGKPRVGAVVMLENFSGVHSWRSNEPTNADGWIEIPAYVGEDYVVEASYSGSNSRPDRKDHFVGRTRIHVSGEPLPVVVVLAPR